MISEVCQTTAKQVHPSFLASTTIVHDFEACVPVLAYTNIFIHNFLLCIDFFQPSNSCFNFNFRIINLLPICLEINFTASCRVSQVNFLFTNSAHRPLPLTVRAPIATRCQHRWWWGGVPEVNKFEQVYSDDDQISLAGKGVPVQ